MVYLILLLLAVMVRFFAVAAAASKVDHQRRYVFQPQATYTFPTNEQPR